MTVTYSLDVANTRFCGFTKLLVRWKGSIYKILWKELLVFSIAYTILSVTYRCFLDDPQKRKFEQVVNYCETFIDLIPLSFVLGFYVSLVIGRWWNQFDAIPFPDKTCYLIATFVHGSDERSRIIRRTLGRYLILLQILTFQAVSTAVKKRFPTINHIQAAGLMTKEERSVYEKVEISYGKWWLPAHWFCALAMRARKEGRIKDSILLESLLTEMKVYRTACGTMFSYDWISVPLVYTQVVTLATYTYSLALLMGRQYLDEDKGSHKHQLDIYVPVFTLLQFFFYIGWLKVAEQIVNPYGEDDDDFELNWCLDRNAQIVYMLVDHLHTKHPKLRRDHFWDELEPQLPHTKFTAKNSINPQLGSAVNLEINPAETDFLPLETLLEEDSDSNVYDSVKHSNRVGYRPSFLMSILNSGLGQSLRRKSTRKGDSFRNNASVQGHVNPAFAMNPEKFSPIKGSTPSNSRSNSRSSSIARRTSSPAHSRASSISLKPGSVNKHRHKLYDLQQFEAGNHANQNGVLPDADVNSVVAALARTATASVVANFEESTFPSYVEETAIEEDAGPQKLSECHMPPIPEEPSRPPSLANLDTPPQETTVKQIEDVHGLVAEANKVLEELNRVVREQGHKKECGSRGYESCCSLSSDESSSEDSTNQTNDDSLAEVIEESSIAVDMGLDEEVEVDIIQSVPDTPERRDFL